MAGRSPIDQNAIKQNRAERIANRAILLFCEFRTKLRTLLECTLEEERAYAVQMLKVQLTILLEKLTQDSK